MYSVYVNYKEHYDYKCGAFSHVADGWHYDICWNRAILGSNVAHNVIVAHFADIPNVFLRSASGYQTWCRRRQIPLTQDAVISFPVFIDWRFTDAWSPGRTHAQMDAIAARVTGLAILANAHDWINWHPIQTRTNKQTHRRCGWPVILLVVAIMMPLATDDDYGLRLDHQRGEQIRRQGENGATRKKGSPPRQSAYTFISEVADAAEAELTFHLVEQSVRRSSRLPPYRSSWFWWHSLAAPPSTPTRESCRATGR